MGHVVPPPDGWVKGNDCGFCAAGETPKYIKVTFSGLIDCPDGCLYAGGGGQDAWKQITDGTQFNEETYQLEQTANPCKWAKDISGSYGILENWNTSFPDWLCESLNTTYPYDILRIEVTKTGNTTVLINAWLIHSANPDWWGGTMLFFNFEGDVSGPLSDCINISAIENSITTCPTVYNSSTVDIAKDGSMQIQEGL